MIVLLVTSPLKMCNDSLNDTDEMCNLYSFKNVTQTYKAQLQKLLNGNTNSFDKCKTSNLTCSNESSLEEIKKTRPVLKKTKKLKESFVEDLESKRSSSDEDLEILATIPRQGVRRSNRLRNKKIDYREDECYFSLNPENLPSSCTKERKRRTKKRKVQKIESEQVPVQEIILDDSTLSSDLEEEEINPELSVKVIWKSITVKRFLIRKFQKMSKVYQDLSKEENVSENKIILTLNNSRVNYNDTPSSLNLKVYDFLEGGILSESSNFTEQSSDVLKNDNSTVVIKFQYSQKNTIKLVLNKNDKIKVGMIKCSEQLEVPLKNIKFFFDGELLDSSETPQSLGLENDDIIDIKINN